MGGIGLPSLHSLQFSFNCSLISRIYNTHSPLSIWLFKVYITPWKEPTSKSSKFWKQVCSDANSAKDCFHFKVTAFSKFALYWDHWYKDKCLREVADFTSFLSSFPVNDSISVILEGENWKLPSSLPHAVHKAFSDIVIAPGSHENIY
ncbi:hypothetical protein KFK09_011181 [Dendrobium nobile]|uniref:Uncharacterized protein n=1 Tax=Dendrobium nobile TaxID=94219 RepID=A0A8T3BC53_DENNO|nr:hypothetical protein KFK09_011181 [Dendrobium nobile]